MCGKIVVVDCLVRGVFLLLLMLWVMIVFSRNLLWIVCMCWRWPPKIESKLAAYLGPFSTAGSSHGCNLKSSIQVVSECHRQVFEGGTQLRRGPTLLGRGKAARSVMSLLWLSRHSRVACICSRTIGINSVFCGCNTCTFQERWSGSNACDNLDCVSSFSRMGLTCCACEQESSTPNKTDGEARIRMHSVEKPTARLRRPRPQNTVCKRRMHLPYSQNASQGPKTPKTI